jgi:hypothetical protein
VRRGEFSGVVVHYRMYAQRCEDREEATESLFCFVWVCRQQRGLDTLQQWFINVPMKSTLVLGERTLIALKPSRHLG